MQTLDFLDKKSLRDDIPEFAPGDTLNVHVNIVEGKNRRVQVFKGFVVGRQGAGIRETFTVRKISFAVPSCTICVIATVRQLVSARSASSKTYQGLIYIWS